jgi:hypothetical protein
LVIDGYHLVEVGWSYKPPPTRASLDYTICEIKP